MRHHKEKERTTSSVGFWEVLGQKEVNKILKVVIVSVINFIRPYLHQFFIDSHGLNDYGKPLKRPFDRY